jgi:hypothetical protein
VEAFDVALVVRFGAFDDLLDEINRFEPDADVPAYPRSDVRSRPRRLRRAS